MHGGKKMFEGHNIILGNSLKISLLIDNRRLELQLEQQ